MFFTICILYCFASIFFRCDFAFKAIFEPADAFLHS